VCSECSFSRLVLTILIYAGTFDYDSLSPANPIHILTHLSLLSSLFSPLPSLLSSLSSLFSFLPSPFSRLSSLFSLLSSLFSVSV